MSKKNILESFYLRRRFSPQRINEKFFQAVKYCLESNQLSPKVSSVEQFKNYVTTVLIDKMHWELFGGDLWAPYDEVFDFLKKEFSDEIENIYYKTKKEGIKENIKIIWEEYTEKLTNYYYDNCKY